jgi:hypothetical protein
MASGVYNTWKTKDGNNWSGGVDADYKWMLVTSSYTPDPDHDNPDDGPAANEIAGGTYARQNIATRTKSADDSVDKGLHSADNPTFTGLVAAAPKYLIGYRVVTNDTDHQLVCWIDLGTVSVTGDLTCKLDGGALSGVAYELT